MFNRAVVLFVCSQRGKFYPQLSYLVKVNTPRAVMAETRKAFKKLPNLEQAITALSNLKGVGTTMASAVLAAASPENAPFMADECLMAIPEIEGIDYTIKEYLNFVQHIQNTVERLNKHSECLYRLVSSHHFQLLRRNGGKFISKAMNSSPVRQFAKPTLRSLAYRSLSANFIRKSKRKDMP